MSERIVSVEPQKYKTIVTNIGNTKIANAALSGQKINITTAIVGDGGGEYYMPTPDATKLKNEVWRGEIAQKKINANSPNMIDVKIIIDGDAGGFTAREIGLLDEEGDMIAICNMPDTEKVIILNGIASTLTVIMHIAFSNIDAVEFIVTPSVDNVSSDELEKAISEHDAGEKSHADIRKEIQRLYSLKPIRMDITIPTSGWIEDTDTGGAYELCADIAVDGITGDLIPMLTILPTSLMVARNCEIGSTAQTIDGALRVYAQTVPEAEIQCSLALLRSGSIGEMGGAGTGAEYVLPVATETRLGGVKIGDNMIISEDGTVSVNIDRLLTEITATESDVHEMLEEVFDSSSTEEGGN